MRGTFANVRIKNLMLPPKPTARASKAASRMLPAERRADGDLRRGDALHRARHADGRVRRRGIRHRQLARLGGEGHAAPRRQGGDRAELRAHPPLEPRRHGRAAAASSRAADSVASLGITGDETFDIVGLEAGIRPQMDVDAGDPPQGRHDAGRAACCCASTRRSRSTTTCTAASCRTCCASCCAA